MFPFFCFAPTYNISFDEMRFPLSGNVDQSWVTGLSREIGLPEYKTLRLIKYLAGKEGGIGIATLAHPVLDDEERAALGRLNRVIETEQARLK